MTLASRMLLPVLANLCICASNTWAETAVAVRTYSGYKGYVFSAALSDDSKYVVTGSSDKTIKLIDLETEAEVRL